MSGETQGREGAERFRGEHQLGHQPIADLITVVEQACGADVTIVGRGDDAHGMTVRHGDTTIIGVVRTPHPMRQRSSVAHELGHVTFDDLTFASGAHRWVTRSLPEVRSDAFARHFLVPLAGVEAKVAGRPVTESLLSELVQSFGASPAIVSIQLREAGLISPDQCEEWRALTTPALATRFGWQARYATVRAESDTVRPPQRLLARATVGYAEGVVAAAMLARLNGTFDVDQTRADLDAAGIRPHEDVGLPAPTRPREVAGGLTAADLDELIAGLDG